MSFIPLDISVLTDYNKTIVSDEKLFTINYIINTKYLQ